MACTEMGGHEGPFQHGYARYQYNRRDKLWGFRCLGCGGMATSNMTRDFRMPGGL